ncbi:MAG: hypothetical protein FD166_542 [Bacteroidetes bacterium]|nr:MAG: hypothetical protein FD166_542 [Bacteroidota bacterium]
MSKSIVFRSGRAAWIIIATFLPTAIGIALFFTGPWFLGLLFLPVMIMTIPIYFRTSYTIHDIDQLTVVCGLMYKKTFNINDIKGVKPSSNVMSAPALSMNRLELRFQNKEFLLISPVKPDQFIEALLAINPAIEVKKK